MLSIFFYNIIISTDNTSDDTLLSTSNCTPASKIVLSSQDMYNNETSKVSTPTCSTSKSDVKMFLLFECPVVIILLFYMT